MAVLKKKKASKRGKAKAKKPKKVGRPRKQHADDDFDMDEVERLGEISCTHQEASFILGMSKRTFDRRMADEKSKLRHAFLLGQSKAHGTLRRRQWDLAMDGHAGMLVWLGKQMLHQSDKGALEITGKDGEPLTPPQTILYLPDNGRD